MDLENEREYNYRTHLPKVRGGWTKDKIIRELKKISGTQSEQGFYREIAQYSNPEEFIKNFCYHGSGTSIGDLKPSIVLKNTDQFGGGYESQYFAISLSTDRNIASNFTGNSRSGSVAPVLIKKGANVISLPEISDSEELEDIIEDLWNKNIDAVIIGKHDNEMSEKEVCILNPKCIVVGKPFSFQVYNKPKISSFTKEELTQLWLESSSKYKEISLKNWEISNASFKAKYGRDKSEDTRWTNQQEKIYQIHQQYVITYNQNKTDLKQAVLGLSENKDKHKKGLKPSGA